MKKLIIVLMLLYLVVSVSANTGKLEGFVYDKNTGDPLPGVNISLLNTNYGAATDVKGHYLLVAPAGTYTLQVTYIGYASQKLKKIAITENKVTKQDIFMVAKKIEGEATVITAQAKGSISAINQMLSSQRMSGSPPLPASMDEIGIPWNTEEYNKINEREFLEVLKNPLSTFAADVDAASYANIRRFIMQDQLPYKDAVRSEECINYFDYEYPQPDSEHPLSIYTEYSDCPWNSKTKLVHIGLQGKAISPEETKASNLVFLLDVSGSMNAPKKLPLLKKAFTMLVEQLDEKDRVSMVVYAGRAGLVLPSTPCNEKEKILNALEKLSAGGSTAGGQGIQLAYKVAEENFVQDGNNRVILATDGDFNVGVSSSSELVRYVEEKRYKGIFLTVLGFGMGNYKDGRLQEIADRGNGNHAYIDNVMEAKKVLVNDLTATLFTIAKDVKIQIEFNPAHIKSYRLIGYENRELKDKDFTDDKKDAGEIGAGHTVTALYEVVPTDPQADIDEYQLKYTDTTIKPEARESREILTVRIRYKEPDGDTSTEMSAILDHYTPVSKTSNNFRFSAAVAQYAMLLRESEFRGISSIDNTRELAKSAIGEDRFGYRHEFLALVDRLALLQDDDQNRIKD